MRNPRIAAVLVVVVLTGSCTRAKPPLTANQALAAGFAAYKAGDIGTASKDFTYVLTLQPSNTGALYDLGLIAQNQGDNTKAEQLYRKVLSIDPQYVNALFNLAIIRAGKGATQEAMDLYTRALKVDPKNAGAHLNLGLLMVAAGDKKGGAKEIGMALTLNPNLRSRLTGGVGSSTATPSA